MLVCWYVGLFSFLSSACRGCQLCHAIHATAATDYLVLDRGIATGLCGQILYLGFARQPSGFSHALSDLAGCW